MNTIIDSPCIGICSTIYGDDVCRGCKRNYQEVINWNQLDPITQQTILQRIEQETITVMQEEVTIFDLILLKEQLARLNIRYRPEQNPLCWVFELLRVGYGKLQSIEKYGFSFKDSTTHESLLERHRRLDEALYELANRHSINKIRDNYPL